MTETQHKTLEEVMGAAERCSKNSGVYCLNCPYGKDKISCRINHNLDVLFYLKQLDCKRGKMIKDIDKIIEAANLCIPMQGHGCYCHMCPYASEENCTYILADDVAEALKRLKFLEKPTQKEQPGLPGI